MTIHNRELNNRLGYIERCADVAPQGMYEIARNASAVIDIVSNHLLTTMRAHGFNVLNDDRLRNIEVAVYGYLVEANPGMLADAEGFGEHVDGPAGERVLANAKRDRDALQRSTVERFTIDGMTDCGDYDGGSNRAPYAVFDSVKQVWIVTGLATREEAEAALRAAGEG